MTSFRHEFVDGEMEFRTIDVTAVSCVQCGSEEKERFSMWCSSCQASDCCSGFISPWYGHSDSALPRMDNRTDTRVDLRHIILKNARFTIACVWLLFLRVSTGNIEERLGPRSYDRDNTRMMVSNENVSDGSSIEADYWEMKNQRGVSRNQILRFRKIGNKGETIWISVLLPLIILRKILLTVQTHSFSKLISIATSYRLCNLLRTDMHR